MSDKEKLVIGTRGSKLALWQANWVRDLLAEVSDLPVEIRVIKTTGDKILDVPLAKVGGKGLFTKEIEVELADGGVDLAVHSMKDVPTELPPGLVMAATPPRADVRDVIVSGPGGFDLPSLPKGGRLGTSSLRRRAQVLALRPDLNVVDVRGNLDTRMRKAEEGEVDAVVLAAAGIVRMGWEDRISHRIPVEQMVPAVGQGAVGVEIREDDELMVEFCRDLTHDDTLACVTAERVVMRSLEGGCQVPIGAYARIDDGVMRMDGLVASLDGTTLLREHVEGPPGQPEELGSQMVERLVALGAREVLDAIRDAAEEGGGDVDGLLKT